MTPELALHQATQLLTGYTRAAKLEMSDTDTELQTTAKASDKKIRTPIGTPINSGEKPSSTKAEDGSRVPASDKKAASDKKVASGKKATATRDPILAAKDAKKIVDNNQVYIMWTMNPDGLNTVWTSDKWRRTNANNVDLNRNYPIGWNLGCGGEKTKDGETYRGDKPFSETETQTMKLFQDDRNFAKVMDFHSYSNQVRTNYGDCASLPKSIDTRFKQIRDRVAKGMQYQASRSCCMGGNIHYAYNRHGSLSYLVETGDEEGGFQPHEAYKNKVLRKVWPGMETFLLQPIDVSGVVTDASTGEPIQAELKLPDINFQLQERHISGKRGHYHMWLPAGPHKVEVWVDDQKRKTVTVKASDSGSVHNIEV